MITSRNAFAVLVAAVVTVAALLAATPAQAATAGLAFASNMGDRSIAIYGPDTDSASHPLGSAIVRVKCHGTKTCTGSASFQDIHLSASGSAGTVGVKPNASTHYSVGRGKTAYITVKLAPNQMVASQALWNWQDNGWAIWGPRYAQSRKAVLRFVQKSPSSREVRNSVLLTQRASGRTLTGTVTGPGFRDGSNRVTDVKVTRWSVKGLQANRGSTAVVNPSTGHFSLGSNYQLGPNNQKSAALYRLSISAQVDGQYRQWFWRGNIWGTGAALGGSAEIREASPVYFNRDRQFQANFNFGQIAGTIVNAGSSSSIANADVRVVAAPFSMPSSKSDSRDLDVPYCANEFGRTTTNSLGQYRVTFLPRSDSGTDKRYLVEVNPSGGNAMTVWNNSYSSCLHARAYTNSRNNLTAIGTSNEVEQPRVYLRKAVSTVDGTVKFAGTPVRSDRYMTLREFIPGKKVLDSPIAASTFASASRTAHYKFSGVKPGKYWLEVGRRTSCSGWYKSRYPNNNSYLQGSDRGAERWKTVSGRKAEYRKSIAMGFPKAGKTPPAGYKGWMYRPYCRTVSAGSYKVVWVHSSGNSRANLSVKKGATISGHVSRGKNANKEYMVSVYSTRGVLVMRSAITNGSGNFKIEGLQSGNYRIAVNTDSWRGNARVFTGTKTKRVKAGGHYSVGTIKISSKVPTDKEPAN